MRSATTFAILAAAVAGGVNAWQGKALPRFLTVYETSNILTPRSAILRGRGLEVYSLRGSYFTLAVKWQAGRLLHFW